ncbi:zinc finger, CCHC-type, retrotransposon gag domain protein [Tanacetum coccineum]
MVNARHKEFLKASTSKGAELSASDAERDGSDNGSSSSSEDLNFRGFIDEEARALSSMIKKQVGKTIKNVMPYFISQTTDNLKEMFDGVLDPIASTRWLAAVECAFRTSNYKEKNKVNFASNFLQFKELFNTEFTPAKEIDRIREEFQTLTQTSETVNDMWKKFNDLIRYCPEYHGNEKLKVERFQRMLHDDIRKVISLFKCTTLDDLLSRARVREANLLRKKSKEDKETKGKLKFRVQDAKKPKQDHNRRSGGNQIKTLCKKYPARVLYDSGASVSFVSYEFSKNLSTPSSKLPFPLEVEIADSKVVVVSNVYRDVEIEIDDSTFRIDLIPIMLGVFDIVIDMDWLDKYNANIFCSQKLVRVINPQG